MSNDRLFHFYEDELAYLASAGPRFARQHPERAALVSLDNVTSRDPDVERLVQAFAFLAGQVRSELQSEMPELTHALMELLWPHYLRMIPSTTTIEFAPDVDQLTDKVIIAPHAGYVESIPLTSPLSTVSDHRTVACQFRNGFELELSPIRIRGVELEKTHRASCLILTFEVGPNADPDLSWGDLRLHLAGDPVSAMEIRYWLLKKTDPSGMTAEVVDSKGLTRTTRVGPFQPVGFDDATALLPYTARSFPGFRLAQEYFCCKHKFLYVDMGGIERLRPLMGGSQVTVRAPLVDHPPDRLRFTTETFRLHCSPAINLFPSAAVPIRYTGRKTEYEIIPDHDTHSHAIYRVVGVSGQREGAGKVTSYQGFRDFRFRIETGDPYYNVAVRAGADGEPVWRLSLVSGSEILPPQTLSVDLECSNGALAGSLLAGQIRYRSVGLPDLVRVSNLTAPEPMLAAPLDSGAQWRFISHLAMNYVSIEDEGTLVGVLKLYDWTKGPANGRRLAGLRRLTNRAGCTFVNGLALRGRELTLDYDEAAFTNEGDAYLFSEVLSRFFALYSNINSYTRLTTRSSGGMETRWPALNGRQQPI